MDRTHDIAADVEGQETMAIPIPFHAAIQPSHRLALDDAAARYADLDPAVAEAVIDAFVVGAIAAWRLEDATYWQRVKFRARLVRTMRRTEGETTTQRANSLPSMAMVTPVNDDRA